MFGLGRTAALAIAASLLGAGLLGSVALGAFSPSATDTLSLTPDPASATTWATSPAGDRLRKVLDGLVAKGIITQAQEDAILGAIRDAGAHEREFLRHVLAKGLQRSADYLGTTAADLRTTLPGTSLAAIANATPGKSRDGLVAALDAAVNDAIDTALANGRVTTEQADRAKAAAPAHIATFVDRTWPQQAPRPGRLPNVKAFLGDLAGAARDYLGISQQDLVAELRDGKSLADVANATPGKSRDGLVAAITTAADAKIDAAQADGKLTADQATAAKAKVATAVGRLVDRTRPDALRRKG